MTESRTALVENLLRPSCRVMPGSGLRMALDTLGGAGGPAAERKVLIIDDDPSVTALLDRLLSREGLGVSTAVTGPAGVATARQLSPDLILLDVELPGMNGFEVCHLLKNDPVTRWIPIIMLTGLREIGDRIQGINAGADDFLSKPFVGAELLARIRALLRMKSLVDQLEHAESVITTLALAVEARDPYTEGHCDRLSVLGSSLASYLQLPDTDITAVKLGGVLHDIGKICIPDSILLKTGKLTEEEWTKMKEHPVQGEAICRPIRSLRAVLPIIRHHHERADGSGYPDGLAGSDIPLTARVLQVVDVFDALTTERPYKKALTDAEALYVLRDEAERGWWDEEIVRAFTHVMRSIRNHDPVSPASGTAAVLPHRDGTPLLARAL